MKKLIKIFKQMICSKCGSVMTQGTSHYGKGLQWECHNCGNVQH